MLGSIVSYRLLGRIWQARGGNGLLGMAAGDPVHPSSVGCSWLRSGLSEGPASLPRGTRPLPPLRWVASASAVPAVPRIVLPHVLDKMDLLKVLWSG